MTLVSATPAPSSWGRRFLRFPLTRIVLASFATALSVGLSMSLASSIADKASRILWPELLGAGAALVSYGLFVRLVEKRQVSELSRVRALPEFGAGLLMGALMVTAVVGVLAALGAYRVTGSEGFSMKLLAPLAEMLLVGVFEEVLCRGIIFGILEESLGSWAALVISALLFGLAHLPGNGAGGLAVAIAVVAGAFFAAAYVLTRRLWLCIGIHIAWNYTLGTVFSIAVSGREHSGLLRGTLAGPEWLTGGTYGPEASVLTLAVLTVTGAYFLWRARARGHLSSRAAAPR